MNQATTPQVGEGMKNPGLTIAFAADASEASLRFIRQMGATDVVTALRGVPPGEVWELESMVHLKQRVVEAGLRLAVFERIPVPDRVKLGQKGRDQDIAAYCESIRNMG
ncbi:MAG: mannonate dehydratase, partial [Gemmatimonadota bacterium]